MQSKKFSIGLMLTYVGATCALAIGAGFSSGQELLQYFVAYGWQMILVAAMFAFIFIYVNYQCAARGKEHNLEDGTQIFEVFCGKYLGKFFNWFCGLFCYLSFIIMVSGAGTTLYQQYGVPVVVGSAIMAVLAVVVAIMGLQGIVNVISKVAPVIIALVLGIAIITIITHAADIVPGIQAVEQGTYDGVMEKVGSNWFMAGLSYGGFMILWFVSFMANLGVKTNTEGGFKELIIGNVIGSVIYTVACVVGACALVSEIGLTASQGIPNLILANQIWPPLATIFAVIIYAAIFTSACPLLYNAVTTVAKEGSARYRVAVLVGAAIALVVAVFVPYQGLVNAIYGYCGYVGAALFFVILVQGIRFFVQRHTEKKGHAETKIIQHPTRVLDETIDEPSMGHEVA